MRHSDRRVAPLSQTQEAVHLASLAISILFEQMFRGSDVRVRELSGLSGADNTLVHLDRRTIGAVIAWSVGKRCPKTPAVPPPVVIVVIIRIPAAIPGIPPRPVPRVPVPRSVIPIPRVTDAVTDVRVRSRAIIAVPAAGPVR